MTAVITVSLWGCRNVTAGGRNVSSGSTLCWAGWTFLQSSHAFLSAFRLGLFALWGTSSKWAESVPRMDSEAEYGLFGHVSSSPWL